MKTQALAAPAVAALQARERRFPMGDTNCMRQLASFYESGCGVLQDFDKAHEWRAKAMGII